MDDVIDKLEFMTEAAHGMYKCISDGINGSRLGPISNVLLIEVMILLSIHFT